jgi:Meiotically up-regulated gene 113
VSGEEQGLMDWPNERYVRVYTRDTVTWKLLDWRGRTVLMLMLRKVDRSGVVDVGEDGAAGLAAVLELPIDVVEAGLAQLMKRRTIEHTGTAFVMPNFLEAQEAPQSDAQRKRASRERRRDLVRAGLRPDQRCEVVYFIQGAQGGPVKIGHTDDVAKRLVTLQIGHPSNLVILATEPGGTDLEEQLHARFAHLRCRGEWFTDTDELQAYIASLTQRDQSHAVTQRDQSHAVTPICADLILADPDPTPACAIPPQPDRAPTPSTVDVLWAELELERKRVASHHRTDYRPLVAHDPGRHDLAGALVDATREGKRDQLVDDARHAIAVAGAEAEADRTKQQWLTGVIFQPKNFRRLAVADLAAARNPPAKLGRFGKPEPAAMPTPAKFPPVEPIADPAKVGDGARAAALLAQLVSDGARAPPASSRATANEVAKAEATDDQPQPAKAAT